MAKAIHQNDKRKVETILNQGVDVNELSSNNDGADVNAIGNMGESVLEFMG